MGVNPKPCCIAFTELQPKLNRSKYTLLPYQDTSTSARYSHILRGRTFLLSPAERFSEKGRYNAKRSKPERRLTRRHRLGGRACRKLGGAGSSPKNTSIALDCAFPSLTDITLWNSSALVCRVGRKISNFTNFCTRQNETAAEINMVTGINPYCRTQ